MKDYYVRGFVIIHRSYSLTFKSVSGIGSSAQDAEIYFTSFWGTRDRIAVVQDTTSTSTSINVGRNFVFIEGV